MAGTISGNYNALALVQDEVQHSLADALQALTTFIDEPDNDAAIELCITHIYQVRGTIEMLNLHGAHLLASEILNSSIAVRDAHNAPNSSAIQDGILKGLLLLPNYLKLLGGEIEDHPLHLLTILNELRIARGDDAFDSNDLFSPNLSVALPKQITPDPSHHLPKPSMSPQKLSQAFQHSLLRWVKDGDALSLRRMSNIARYLRLSCIQEQSIVLWWAAEGVLEGLLEKGLPATAEIKIMIGRLNAPIKLFINEGEQNFIALYPADLAKKLLLQVARATSVGKHVTALKDTFNLNFFDPQPHQKIYNFTDNALLDVHSELIVQIQEIADKIERFSFNEQTSSEEDIGTLVSQLNNMAGTFYLLTDRHTSTQLKEQAGALNEMIAQQSMPSDDQLLSLANTLLNIKYQLQSEQKINHQQTVAIPQPQQIVITECLNELIAIKEAIVSLDEGSENASGTLAEIANQLDLIAGSLTTLNLNDAAALLENTSQQLRQTVSDEKSLTADELDLFAEIIASADVYMENIKQGGFQQSQLLKNAQNSLSQFNSDIDKATVNAPLETTVDLLAESDTSRDLEPEPQETEGARYINSPEQSVAATLALDETGVARYISEQQSNATVTQSSANFAEGIDPEIAGIFVEEAQEILHQQAMLIPQWQSDHDLEKLTEIRHYFHTLKGSSRVAGAHVIGDLSWSIEHLLNQVLDGLQSTTPDIVELVKLGHSTIPDLIARFSSGEMASTNATVIHLMNSANSLLTEKVEEIDQTEGADSEKNKLQQIFYGEATQHLATFKTALEQTELPFALNKELLRAAHSLKGCANIAQITPVATVAIQLDQILRTLYENNIHLNEQQFSLLSATINGLESIIEIVGTGGGTSSTNETELVENLKKILSCGDAISTAEETKKRIDPEFLAVYLEETDDLLTTYSTQLEQLQRQPDNGDYQTAVHQTLTTLEDNARHAQLGRLVSLYQLLDRLAARPDNNNGSISALLDLGYEEVNSQIESLMQNQLGDNIDEYSRQVEVALSQAPELAPESVQDKPHPHITEQAIELFAIPSEESGLLEIFIEECAELLGSIDNAIKIWQQNNSDQEAVLRLQRDLHTLKGSSRLMAVIPIADLTHQTESLMFLAIDNKCETDDRFFNLLLRCQDRLAEMREQLANNTDFAFAHDLVAEIAHFGNQLVPIQTVIAKPTVIPVAEGQTKNKVEATVHHEQIRVRADLLDFLSNFAGEVNISRDRVTQQNRTIHLQLSEMDITVDRLQDQLRHLEIETETQILFRYEDEDAAQDSDFDPLELDRFSMIQQLSRSLTESVSDMNEITHSLDDLVRDSDSILLQQSRLSTELQQGLMSIRLLPFDGLIPRFERLIRQVNTELGKKSRLVTHGAELELDRAILDRIVAPIEHIFRNAIAHGIERPEERSNANKDETGTLTLSIAREGSEILISLSDDGQGIDIEKVRRIALEQALINPEHGPSDDDLIQLILSSGFSTSDDISQIAGRGVGLDVVNSEIRALKGRLSIQSTAGKGATFNVRLPLTLSIMQSLLVSCGDHEYAIPLAAIHSGERMTVQEISDLLENEDEPRYEFNGEYYTFILLANLLKETFVLPKETKLQLPVLLFHYGDMHIALLVDSINSNREIVLKPVGEQLAHIDAITGATIMGDGHVVFILDISTLVDTAHLATTNEEGDALLGAPDPQEISDRAPIALVVDDSITMRKASGNLLKRHGFDVMTARDGIDAIAQLSEQMPDIILLDIEMPRMDGFEFATLVRNIEHYKSLPIIMVTSRTGDKHRERAFGIGVNAYLGKPYQEAKLIETIQELLNPTST